MLLVPLAASVLGCAGPAPRTHAVAIRGFQYHPSVVTVSAGDTVAWTNVDLVPHTASARAQGMDTGTIESQGAGRVVADTKGTYSYVCAFHPGMRGTLVVQ